jgi:hypothetical protein
MANRYGNTRQNRETTVRRMATYLRSLANRRSSGVVTADDANAFLAREGFRVNVKTRLSYINTVFGSGMFEQTGMTYSTRPQAKGRAISTWATA